MAIEIRFPDTVINNMLTTLGNGSKEIGYARLVEICERLIHARAKHSWDGYNKKDGFNAIFGEFEELGLAVRIETPERQHDEALDVIATAIRFANREFDK